MKLLVFQVQVRFFLSRLHKVLVCLQVAVPVDRRLIGYIVANIGEFARTHGMTVREAGNYLNRYKGLDFLAEHYEAEHLSATAYRI